MTSKTLAQKHWEWLSAVADRVPFFKDAKLYLLDTDSKTTTFWLVSATDSTNLNKVFYDFVQVTDQTEAMVLLPTYPRTVNDLISIMTIHRTGVDFSRSKTNPMPKASVGIRHLTKKERRERTRCLAQLESRIRALGKLLGLKEEKSEDDE